MLVVSVFTVELLLNGALIVLVLDITHAHFKFDPAKYIMIYEIIET